MKVWGKRGTANVTPKVERVVSREWDAPADYKRSGDRRELLQRDLGPNTRRKTNLAYCMPVRRPLVANNPQIL